MIKISEKIKNRFIYYKYPKIKIGAEKEAVLFLDRKEIYSAEQRVIKFLKNFFNLVVYGIRYIENGNKIQVSVKSQGKYNYDKYFIFRRLLEQYLPIFYCDLPLIPKGAVFADFNELYKQSLITEKEFAEIARNVIRTKIKYLLNPIYKSKRAQLKIWSLNYKHIGIRTNGQADFKRMIIYYKE